MTTTEINEVRVPKLQGGKWKPKGKMFDVRLSNGISKLFKTEREAIKYAISFEENDKTRCYYEKRLSIL